MNIRISNAINSAIVDIKKSINENLRNSDKIITEDNDTATSGSVLKPPVPMSDCKYVFDNSSYVAKCCRILAKDIVLNEITLTSEESSNDEIVKKINGYLNDNINEIYNVMIDYYYAGIGAIEYSYNTHKFILKQIPINTTTIIVITINDKQHYLLKQKIQTKTNYFKIMGEDYPPNFEVYNNQVLGECCLIGGDNFYQFFNSKYFHS